VDFDAQFLSELLFSFQYIARGNFSSLRIAREKFSPPKYKLALSSVVLFGSHVSSCFQQTSQDARLSVPSVSKTEQNSAMPPLPNALFRQAMLRPSKRLSMWSQFTSQNPSLHFSTIKLNLT
jgi:hypothetical protein